LYVGKGTPVFDTFSSLFKSLMPTVELSGNEHLDKWLSELGATQPEFAKSLGNPIYSLLLELHEFMQSDEDVADSEWRIISKLKGSWSKGMKINEVKQDMLRIAKAGLLPTLKFETESVDYFTCLRSEKKMFLNKLPEKWQHIPVVGLIG